MSPPPPPTGKLVVQIDQPVVADALVQRLLRHCARQALHHALPHPDGQVSLEAVFVGHALGAHRGFQQLHQAHTRWQVSFDGPRALSTALCQLRSGGVHLPLQLVTLQLAHPTTEIDRSRNRTDKSKRPWKSARFEEVSSSTVCAN